MLVNMADIEPSIDVQENAELQHIRPGMNISDFAMGMATPRAGNSP
jgi:hypothetical protein